jgi:cytochrome c oxidase assembly protein subunit 15
MAYFAVPAFAQPIHLTVAIMMLGIQFVIWTSLDANKELKNIMPRKTEALVS